jgi:hypothetical protein
LAMTLDYARDAMTLDYARDAMTLVTRATP